MLQCECGVALCVPCARTQFVDTLEATYLDYHKASVACPKCQVAPICFTIEGARVEKPRVGYNVDANSVAEIDRRVAALVDEALLRCGTSTTKGKNRATYYKAALKHYRTELGLLCDVREPTGTDSSDFFRLALARAETHCQRGTWLRDVSLHDLPLGPLEALKFVEHKALDLYLHGQPVSNACCICLDPIAPGDTAFSMCTCAEVNTDARLSHTLPSLRRLIGVPCVCSGSAGPARSSRWGGRAKAPRPTPTSTSTTSR
jgi:hypothetical protein